MYKNVINNNKYYNDNIMNIINIDHNNLNNIITNMINNINNINATNILLKRIQNIIIKIFITITNCYG